jgi:hypothetical protein
MKLNYTCLVTKAPQTGRAKVLSVETKTGVWTVEELENGSLRVRVVDTHVPGLKGMVALVPTVSNEITIEVR